MLQTLRGRGLVSSVPFRDNGKRVVDGIAVEIKGNRERKSNGSRSATDRWWSIVRADTKHDQNGGGGLVSSSVRVSDLEGSKSGKE